MYPDKGNNPVEGNGDRPTPDPSVLEGGKGSIDLRSREVVNHSPLSRLSNLRWVEGVEGVDALLANQSARGRA